MSYLKKNSGDAIVIGTPDAINFYSAWQENAISGITTCQSNNSLINVQFQSAIDPQSGCNYSSEDPFKSTTDWIRDESYGDHDILGIYNSTNEIVDEFNQLFFHNLTGNELAVAAVTNYLIQTSKQYCIVLHSKEINLASFCQTNGWNYKILN